jgi:hypothetical protein
MRTLVFRRGLMPLVVLVAVIALTGCGKSDVQALAVNAVAADPQAYSGEIAIKGVVQRVDATTSSFSIIDETEYQTCGLTPCNTAGTIPLAVPTSQAAQGGSSYSGTLPALEDVVVVFGEVKSGAQGLYFDVARVERDSRVIIERGR